MNRKLLSLAALSLMIHSSAQIFSSGFENNNGTPLSSYTTINADGNQVAVWAPVPEFSTQAWIQFYDGFDNKIAFSTSSYDPAGVSNDWLITPAITLPAEGSPTLYWKAKSYDFEFTDSYSIKISETDTQPGSFINLLQVDGEQAYDFNARSLDLSAYKGKTIHLAIVNNTDNGYYLALDDLYISNSANCIMPEFSEFTVSGLTEKSFTASWAPTTGINTLDVGLTDFHTPVASGGIQTATTKSFDQLQPGKRYQLFLKNADCGSGWAGPKSVFTAAQLPYAYDFEYTEENYGEYDSDGWTSGTWINGSGSVAQNGNGYVFNNTSKTYAKNDWIFSYPIKLNAGETVKIRYYAQMGNATASPATLKVSAATAPSKDQIIQEISSNAISGNTYTEYLSEYTATTEGVYYFGFGNVTPPVAVNAALRLDNIRFEKGVLAVDHSVKQKISVYPNPVKTVLTVKSPVKIDRTEVYSMDGRMVLKVADSNEIDFSQLPKGVYLLKIFTQEGVQMQKVLK